MWRTRKKRRSQPNRMWSSRTKRSHCTGITLRVCWEVVAACPSIASTPGLNSMRPRSSQLSRSDSCLTPRPKNNCSSTTLVFTDLTNRQFDTIVCKIVFFWDSVIFLYFFYTKSRSLSVAFQILFFYNMSSNYKQFKL